jgi:hypothetical protein
VAATALLAGCTSSVSGLLEDVAGADDANLDKAKTALAHTWLVSAYTGDQTGIVDVPAEANLRWTFRDDGTFTVVSDQALSIGGDATRAYNDAGTWAITNAAGRHFDLTVTSLGGETVPANQREAVDSSWRITGDQLIVTTGALGPGVVRYVATLVAE